MNGGRRHIGRRHQAVARLTVNTLAPGRAQGGSLGAGKRGGRRRRVARDGALIAALTADEWLSSASAWLPIISFRVR